MAEPRRLHNRALHVGVRVGGALFAAVTFVAAVSIALEQRAQHPFALAILALPFTVLLLMRATVWRTRPVHASDTHLEVGPRAHARRVPFADLVSIDRPWWAYPDTLFSPLELTVRNAPPVLFFPADGAQPFLATHLAQPRR
jgi:hypothetical protein